MYQLYIFLLAKLFQGFIIIACYKDTNKMYKE